MSLKSLLNCMMACSLLLVPLRARSRSKCKRSCAAVQLPAGDAQELVSDTCSSCHSLTNITNSQGHTPEEWKTTVAMHAERRRGRAS